MSAPEGPQVEVTVQPVVPSLTPDPDCDQGTDYILTGDLCWVEVGSVVLCIVKDPRAKEVRIEAFTAGDEMGECLDAMRLDYAELER